MTNQQRAIEELERRQITTPADRLRAALTLFDDDGLCHRDNNGNTVAAWIVREYALPHPMRGEMERRAGTFARERLAR